MSYCYKRILKAGLGSLLIFSLIITNSLFAYAAENCTYEDGYNENMALMGLTYERYRNMSEETQAIYAEMDFSSVEETSKYYRVTTTSNTANSQMSTFNVQESTIMEEISREQYEVETMEYLDNIGYYHMLQTVDVPEDDTSTSWLEMTTRLSLGATNRWALSNDATWVQGGTGANDMSTDVIALGVNAQCSILADSEYLHRHCDLCDIETGIRIDDVDYYHDVQKKSAVGYAAYYNVESVEWNNEVYFIVALTTNNSDATVIDGFGHYSRRNVAVEPTISFGSDGGSISFSPSTKWSHAPNTHVQLAVE